MIPENSTKIYMLLGHRKSIKTLLSSTNHWPFSGAALFNIPTSSSCSEGNISGGSCGGHCCIMECDPHIKLLMTYFK